MHELHDRSYAVLFSNKEIFRQLLTSFVHEAWVQQLDFTDCELVKGNFVSKKYKKTFTDLLYKVKLRGRDFYVVVLLEFKSTPARFVAIQMAGYILDFYRHLLETEKRLRKLPPVFPVLLYNGKRPWTPPADLTKLIDNASLLGEYGLQFKYFPIIEQDFSPEVLQRMGNIVSTLFLAETHYDSETITRELQKLRDTIKNEQALSVFFNWFTQLFVHGRIDETDYTKFEQVYQSKEELSMLLEAFQKEKKQLRALGKREGKREGKIEGKIEGKKEGKLEIAKMMVKSGMPLAQVARYTGLSKAALLKLQTDRRN